MLRFFDRRGNFSFTRPLALPVHCQWQWHCTASAHTCIFRNIAKEGDEAADPIDVSVGEEDRRNVI